MQVLFSYSAVYKGITYDICFQSQKPVAGLENEALQKEGMIKIRGSCS